MAWSEQLPSGKYRAVYRDSNGKRRSAGTFTHKAAARRAANTAESDALKAGWRSPDAGRRTWGEWCAQWWPNRMVSAATLIGDASRRDVHLMPRWEHVELADITRHDIRAWAVTIIRSGRSAATAQRAVHLLSASLNAAIDQEIITANPAAKLKIETGRPTIERYLTYTEVDAIVANMPTTRDQNIVYLLAYSGMRWGELAGLHWNRVDRETGAVTIAEPFDLVTRTILSWTKGKKARQVRLPDWLIDRLGPPTAGPCGVTHQTGRCTSGLVVTSERGSVLDSGNWRPIFDRAVAAAGLEHLWPHLLRHTTASWLIQSGASLAQVGKVLGHTSPTTTQRYAHLVTGAADDILALPTPPGVMADRHLRAVS